MCSSHEHKQLTEQQRANAQSIFMNYHWPLGCILGRVVEVVSCIFGYCSGLISVLSKFLSTWNIRMGPYLEIGYLLL